MISLSINDKDRDHSSLIPYVEKIILDRMFEQEDVNKVLEESPSLFMSIEVSRSSEIDKNSTINIYKSSVKDLANSQPLMKGLNLIPNNKTKHVYSFRSLQKWEGVIEEIYADCFIARLTDLTYGGADEEVELQLSEINQEDMNLLKVGAIFYWSIGHELSKGQMRKISFIRFRRLPPWNPKQWDQALDLTNKYKKIKWD